jgi:hypothetical protein
MLFTSAGPNLEELLWLVGAETMVLNFLLILPYDNMELLLDGKCNLPIKGM